MHMSKHVQIGGWAGGNQQKNANIFHISITCTQFHRDARLFHFVLLFFVFLDKKKLLNIYTSIILYNKIIIFLILLNKKFFFCKK